MTVWFVSRHPGAIAWAKNQKLKVDRWAVFEALTFAPAFSERGKELATRDLERLDCRLVRYDIHALS